MQYQDIISFRKIGLIPVQFAIKDNQIIGTTLKEIGWGIKNFGHKIPIQIWSEIRDGDLIPFSKNLMHGLGSQIINSGGKTYLVNDGR